MKQTGIKKMARCRTGNWLLALAVAASMTMASRCSAATEYVSLTSTNPSPPYATPGTAPHDIQDAVNVANNGDTVLVLPGQYNLTNQVTITKAIALRSTGGAGVTSLNALTAIWCLWVSNSLAVADGFTFETNPGNDAGGVDSFGATIQNCTFTGFIFPGPGPGNAVTMVGGILSNSVAYFNHFPYSSTIAVYCTDGGLVTDCQILATHDSQAGTGIYLENSQLRNSVVLGTGVGSPTMGGPAVVAVNSTIGGCTISRSYGYGPGSGANLNNCLMDRCVIASNACQGGPGQGGGIFETNSIIRDSLITGNVARGNSGDTDVGVGGGVYMQGGEVVNCTVSGNSAVNTFDVSNTNDIAKGAGVYVESGGVTNCIIFGNAFLFNGPATSNIEWFNAGPGIFDHCCTTPDPGGSGNIIQDPQFVTPTNGNFHLASTSPCIAAGVVQAWMTNATDLDGNPRTTNGVVDMGAYQSRTATKPQPVTANFTANPSVGLVPLTVQFTDHSTGPVTGWHWGFGDGATSAVQSPSHTYTNAGNYTVTLVVTGSVSQADSDSQIITVTNVSPTQQVTALMGQVDALVQQSVLNRGQGNQLDISLKLALDSLNNGDTAATCDLVARFMARVQALMNRGELTPAQGQSLISAASQLRSALGCSP